MINTVCIFASSCNYLESEYYTDAKILGGLLAKSGMDVVYGGSCLGLMWACADEVKKQGGRLIGVMPTKLKEMDVFSDYCDEFFETPCMRSRKAKMDELSDALIALPGGFGTLEELSEMIVQKQLGYNDKAIVILNTNGFYDNLLNFFDDILNEKFANRKAGKLYFVANTPQEAVDYLTKYEPENLAITKADIYTR
ncbi:MAG: TIGR00730 family Rossman fold protein [Clostridium sp.]|nr:TIGR00730 family Rossman fold protein [Clostridium sp.]